MLYIQSVKLTVKVKLLPTLEQKASLIKTIEVFNDACNYISGIAWKSKRFGQVSLHPLCYHQVRDKFGLSAQMTVRAIGKTKETYRINKKNQHIFKKYSAMVYDGRILTFRGLDTVSILSIDGRFKIPVVFGSYAKLQQRRIRGQANLIYRKGNLFLCVCIELPDGTPIIPKGTLGVDLGIKNIAVDSTGEVFSGNQINGLRKRHAKLRAKLQSKRTKSAKRLLKHRNRKEGRFARDINHQISKKVVEKAKRTSCGIALEDLKGIRKRIRARKVDRRQQHSWGFFQLRTFIEYKAKLAGVLFQLVDPRNTSRTCPACGCISKSNRRSQSQFSCIQCGFSGLADAIAAVNIGRAAVNQPNVGTDCASA